MVHAVVTELMGAKGVALRERVEEEVSEGFTGVELTMQTAVTTETGAVETIETGVAVMTETETEEAVQEIETTSVQLVPTEATREIAGLHIEMAAAVEEALQGAEIVEGVVRLLAQEMTTRGGERMMIARDLWTGGPLRKGGGSARRSGHVVCAMMR